MRRLHLQPHYRTTSDCTGRYDICRQYLGEVVDDELVDGVPDVAQVVVLGNRVEHDGRVGGDVGQVVDAHVDDDADAELVGALEQRPDRVVGDLDLGRVDERQHGADHLRRKLRHLDRHHLACTPPLCGGYNQGRRSCFDPPPLMSHSNTQNGCWITEAFRG